MKKKKTILLIISMFFSNFSYNQNLSIIDSVTANQLADKIIGQYGVAWWGNAKTVNLEPKFRGFFNKEVADSVFPFGLNEGIVLSIHNLIGYPTFGAGCKGIDSIPYYDADNANCNWLLFEDTTFANNIDPYIDSLFLFPHPNYQYYVPGNGQLTNLYNSTLSFDFVPGKDSIQFNYIYASERFHPNPCDEKTYSFFVAMLSGPGIEGKVNIATVPGTDLPITEKSINDAPLYMDSISAAYVMPRCYALGYDAPYAEYYVANWLDSTTRFIYDGYTTALTARAAVNPCDTYHIEIRVQAVIHSSAIGSCPATFIGTNSFYSYGAACSTDTATSIDTDRAETESLLCYPNPFTDGLTLKLQGDAAPSSRYTVGLYDVLGKEVRRADGNFPTIHHYLKRIGIGLPEGLYLLRLTDERGKSYTKKVRKR